MMMILGPVEVFGYTPGGAEKVELDLDNGTELGSLSGFLKGSHNGIPYGSFLEDSLEVQTRSIWSLIMGMIWTGSLEGSNDGITYGSFL